MSLVTSYALEIHDQSFKFFEHQKLWELVQHDLVCMKAWVHSAAFKKEQVSLTTHVQHVFSLAIIDGRAHIRGVVMEDF